MDLIFLQTSVLAAKTTFESGSMDPSLLETLTQKRFLNCLFGV